MKLTRKDFENIYGDAPGDFHLHLLKTLNGLEEKRIKKRRRLSTMLLAAALCVALLAGAGFAATQLGVFHLMDTANPIVPLEGAEQLVSVRLGTSENEYAVLTLEEAVFDGQGVMVQCRLSPKDTEKYALFDDMMQDAFPDVYDTECLPAEIGEGSMSETDDDGNTVAIINEGGVQRLLVNDEEIPFPASREEAQQKDLPVYQQDGRLYYSDYMERRILGRKDGRKIMNYWLYMDTDEDKLSENTSDAREQEDGSILFWAEGMADEQLNRDEIEICIRGQVTLDGVNYPLDGLSARLPKSEDERSYRLEPIGDGRLERFELLSAGVSFTKIRGYLHAEYIYDESENEPMGVTFDLFDGEGNEITVGSGGAWERGENHYYENLEIQSFAQAPETICLQVRAIGSDTGVIGRIECRLVEE